MKIKNKINFKQPKYIFPLVALPFVFFVAYQLLSFTGKEDVKEEKQKSLATSLGEIQDSILTKNEAYDLVYENKDSRTMIDALDDEEDSLLYYTNQLSQQQKRYIDSLEFARKEQQRDNANAISRRKSYYNPEKSSESKDEDYERSMEIIRMLNEGEKATEQQTKMETKEKDPLEENPTQVLRDQLFLLDSLEKANDPEYRAQLAAQKKLKENQKMKEDFLNSTMKVSKKNIHESFNHISSESEEIFIKAVIDENTKGYLGSRIRFRILEDIFVGNYKIPQGSIMYGLISGFDLQRVNISIVSVWVHGKILPINLSVYDVDGMKGLYVPNSMFREMIREFGTNSVQGTSLDSENQNFFSSLLSKAFSSTSQTIANIIRKNKAKLKYNTHIYLINENELQNEK